MLGSSFSIGEDDDLTGVGATGRHVREPYDPVPEATMGRLPVGNVNPAAVVFWRTLVLTAPDCDRDRTPALLSPPKASEFGTVHSLRPVT